MGSVGNYVRNQEGKNALICLTKLVEHLGIEEVLLTNDKGLSYYAEWLEVKELQPIPITPEWLQKNGFEGVERGGYYFYRHIDRAIRISIYKDIIRTEIAGEPTATGANTNYVHQLQNFLTLCGVELELKM